MRVAILALPLGGLHFCVTAGFCAQDVDFMAEVSGEAKELLDGDEFERPIA